MFQCHWTAKGDVMNWCKWSSSDALPHATVLLLQQKAPHLRVAKGLCCRYAIASGACGIWGLVGKDPLSSVLRNCYFVARLAVHLALLELIVKLEDGLAVLPDRWVKVRPPLALHKDLPICQSLDWMTENTCSSVTGC